MRQFHKIRVRRPRSSVFNLSHEKKLTLNMGDLVPVYHEEVIPGDKFRINLEAFAKFQPLTHPIMHRINVYTHFFFVPNRLLWDEWEDFITGGKDGTLSPSWPAISGMVNQQDHSHLLGIGSLADYLGIPVQNIDLENGQNLTSISRLPFSGYQMIFNEYYRDQTLQDEVEINKTSGTLSWASELHREHLATLRKRCWEKDYFTSALPFAQRGEQVKLPLIGDIEVQGSPMVRKEAGNDPWQDGEVATDPGGRLSGGPPEYEQLRLEELYGSLDASQTTITELRRAYALQRWLEKNARAGGRYAEQILAHFGVKLPDFRLQKPEYIGGGKMPVKIQEVVQHSATAEEGTPQGTNTGNAFASGRTRQVNRSFNEHGQIFGIMSVMPRTAYFQGLERKFTRSDRFDYFFPEFARIGEQEIKKQELFLDSSQAVNTQTFGYQERYAEYRTKNDSIHGDFRKTLKAWHMARHFEDSPELNESFVQSDPTDRIFAVEDEEWKKLLVHTYANVRARRPIPKFGDPV